MGNGSRATTPRPLVVLRPLEPADLPRVLPCFELPFLAPFFLEALGFFAAPFLFVLAAFAPFLTALLFFPRFVLAPTITAMARLAKAFDKEHSDAARRFLHHRISRADSEKFHQKNAFAANQNGANRCISVWVK